MFRWFSTELVYPESPQHPWNNQTNQQKKTTSKEYYISACSTLKKTVNCTHEVGGFTSSSFHTTTSYTTIESPAHTNRNISVTASTTAGHGMHVTTHRLPGHRHCPGRPRGRGRPGPDTAATSAGGWSSSRPSGPRPSTCPSSAAARSWRSCPQWSAPGRVASRSSPASPSTAASSPGERGRD